MRAADRARPHAAPAGRLRGAAAAGRRPARQPAAVASAVAVLLGDGRRGAVDAGEGAADVVAGPRTRPHQRPPTHQQAQGTVW